MKEKIKVWWDSFTEPEIRPAIINLFMFAVGVSSAREIVDCYLDGDYRAGANAVVVAFLWFIIFWGDIQHERIINLYKKLIDVSDKISTESLILAKRAIAEAKKTQEIADIVIENAKATEKRLDGILTEQAKKEIKRRKKPVIKKKSN